MAGGEGAAHTTDSEKIRIANDLLMNAPPGEFNEVFNSVRMLLNNDQLMREGCVPVLHKYHMDQFFPIKLDGAERFTLITKYNQLGGDRYADEMSGKSFKFDHMRREASDVADLPPGDAKIEAWRLALQSELDKYIEEHFPRGGIGCVFTRNKQVVVCIESHQFQPSNYVMGRWRSSWVVPVGEGQQGAQDMKGEIKVQVHYFEEGNVQLVSDKAKTVKVQISGDIAKTAKSILNEITNQEATYQTGMQENYAAMSEGTFKALRRQLPVTRTKMDWMKVQSYRIGQEMRPQ